MNVQILTEMSMEYSLSYCNLHFFYKWILKHKIHNAHLALLCFQHISTLMLQSGPCILMGRRKQEVYMFFNLRTPKCIVGGSMKSLLFFPRAKSATLDYCDSRLQYLGMHSPAMLFTWEHHNVIWVVLWNLSYFFPEQRVLHWTTVTLDYNTKEYILLQCSLPREVVVIFFKRDKKTS